MATGRNFRSGYYEKVGFRSIEAKKSIEGLFKENPIDKKKLASFTLRYTVPNSHRCSLYSILFDILPTCKEVWDYVRNQQKQHYNDLVHALNVLQVKNNVSLTKSQLFVLMSALESGNLKLNFIQQLSTPDSIIFMRISDTLLKIMETAESDVYWISQSFSKFLISSYRPHIDKLNEYTTKVIKKDDRELYDYLVKSTIFENLPLSSWYKSALLPLIPAFAVQKVWDKLIGGSSIVMVFVIFSLLLKIRSSIFQLSTAQMLIDYTKELTDTCYENIVNDGISLWQRNGSPLTPGSKNDCFKEHKNLCSIKSLNL